MIEKRRVKIARDTTTSKKTSKKMEGIINVNISERLSPTIHRKKEDYYHEMNFENYSKWLEDKLMPNLKLKSMLLIDNESYHNVQEKGAKI